MQSSIGERGQITIPKAVRRQLGLRPGMRLEVSVENGAVTLRRPGIDDAIEAWEGTAENLYGSTDEYLHRLRDES
ncbi:MAG: AbrB/MazE/SpoVT family DNA-binding domain-containing protein [Alkalispirochaeta sp.]